MKPITNLTVNTLDTGELTEEQEALLDQALGKTDEEIAQSLARAKEDIKAGRVSDAFESLNRMRARYNV